MPVEGDCVVQVSFGLQPRVVDDTVFFASAFCFRKFYSKPKLKKRKLKLNKKLIYS